MLDQGYVPIRVPPCHDTMLLTLRMTNYRHIEPTKSIKTYRPFYLAILDILRNGNLATVFVIRFEWVSKGSMS